jgi:hypothetical protein
VRCRSLLVLLAVLFATACPKQKGTSTTSANEPGTLREQTTGDGNLVIEVDLDGDGRADLYNYYRQLEDGGRLLLRKELDLNRDGRIDVWSFYTETGAMDREEMDGDYDGNVDWIDHYQGDKRVMSEIDTSNTGRFDLFKYYEGDHIRRKERDTNGDGKIDHWEYFDDKGENVIKVGWDIDGDGQMDVREE